MQSGLREAAEQAPPNSLAHLSQPHQLGQLREEELCWPDILVRWKEWPGWFWGYRVQRTLLPLTPKSSHAPRLRTCTHMQHHRYTCRYGLLPPVSHT